MLDITYFLLPLGALALIGLIGGDSDDEPADDTPVDDGESPAEEVAGAEVTLSAGDDSYLGDAGNDTVTADDGFQGQIDAGAGNDAITVTGTAEALPRAERVSYAGVGWLASDAPEGAAPYTGEGEMPDGLIEVLGRGGDDTITASGAGLWIRSGTGADLIDASGISDGFVAGEAGDTIIGSDVVDDSSESAGYYTAVLRGGVDYRGGDGDEEIAALGGENTVTGAGGDDILYSSGESTLSGGDGEDELYGQGLLGQAGEFVGPQFDKLASGGDDVLDGGAGDDWIAFGHADTVIGGDGTDSYLGVIDPDSRAVLADFEPEGEVALLHLDPQAVSASFDEMSVVEKDGDTLVLMGDQVVVTVQGQTGLSVALNVSGLTNTPEKFFDLVALDGSPYEGDSFPNLILNRYEPQIAGDNDATGSST